MAAEGDSHARQEDPEPLDGTDPLPPGRYVPVRNRGPLFVREVAGPPDAPALVLLHGWCATGGLNWFRVFEPLSRHFRILAPDLRGHGRGPRNWRRFRLEDCADDVAALIRHLGAGPAIVAGYSMGGPIAQLLWKQHAPLVAGLVLCATADRLVSGLTERLVLRSLSAAMAGTTRLGRVPVALPRWVVRSVLPEPEEGTASAAPNWAAAEVRRHDVRMLMEAGYAISHYDGSGWTPRIPVPTAVLLTLKDRLVSEAAQRATAQRIPNARIFPLPDGHLACATEAFANPLVEACLDVASRAQQTRADREAG